MNRFSCLPLKTISIIFEGVIFQNIITWQQTENFWQYIGNIRRTKICNKWQFEKRRSLEERSEAASDQSPSTVKFPIDKSLYNSVPLDNENRSEIVEFTTKISALADRDGPENYDVAKNEVSGKNSNVLLLFCEDLFCILQG